VYDKEHFLELYVRHMLSQPDKDVHIDAVKPKRSED
jgi:hypothetical protein